jgi:ABC-type multidrug transport system ATPase subunit
MRYTTPRIKHINTFVRERVKIYNQALKELQEINFNGWQEGIRKYGWLQMSQLPYFPRNLTLEEFCNYFNNMEGIQKKTLKSNIIQVSKKSWLSRFRTRD